MGFVIHVLHYISIHPMLRFNRIYPEKFKGELKISIHPMLRLNTILNHYGIFAQIFQYILCYGSTVERERDKHSTKHFNTSYVTVQRN